MNRLACSTCGNEAPAQPQEATDVRCIGRKVGIGGTVTVGTHPPTPMHPK